MVKIKAEAIFFHNTGIVIITELSKLFDQRLVAGEVDPAI